jgi:hypothetical protein
MIRRNVIRSEGDQRVVRWALIAAALAFGLGSFAETKLQRHAQEQAAPEVVQQAQPLAVNPAG